MLETAKVAAPDLPSELATIAESQAASCRFDPLQGNWTIFAPTRQQRPDQFEVVRSKTDAGSGNCPFCAGSESQTPDPVWIGRPIPELADDPSSGALSTIADGRGCLAIMEIIDQPNALSQTDTADWMVRVVPNKFPAISPVGTELPHGSHSKISLFPEHPVFGGHEVIVESPTHCQSILELDAANIALVFAAYRDRLRYWHDVDGIRYVSLFKNSGGEAGASLVHSHSQLIATGMMPNRVQLAVNRMLQYRAQTGCCLQCDLLRAEIKDKRRIIAQYDDLIAFCPFASQFPMTVRITTKTHVDRFELLDDATIESVSLLVKRVAGWIEKIRPGASYNYLINTRPAGAEDCAESYHWSLDIIPRISQIAGFELSSDCMINSVMPEIAAAEYRACACSEDPRLVL